MCIYDLKIFLRALTICSLCERRMGNSSPSFAALLSALSQHFVYTKLECFIPISLSGIFKILLCIFKFYFSITFYPHYDIYHLHLSPSISAIIILLSMSEFSFFFFSIPPPCLELSACPLSMRIIYHISIYSFNLKL